MSNNTEQQIETNNSSNEKATLNLDDVGYMIMVGRKKNGETFFHNINIDDLILIKGLVEYAQHEVDWYIQENIAHKRQKQQAK